MSEMSGRDQRYVIGEEFDPMGENILTIAELHKRAERDVPPHQRKIEEAHSAPRTKTNRLIMSACSEKVFSFLRVFDAGE